MQRAPTLVTLLLFAALCASLAYWLLQWLAPAPRAVAAPPEVTRTLPPVAAAATLFGGRPTDAGGTAMQLRGILRVGRAGGSVAIIAAEGKPPRAVAVNAEVLPGVTVKEIQARTVVLSERGAERELSLPAFAVPEASTVAPQGVAPDMPPAMAPQAPASPTAQAPQQGSPSASSVGGGEIGSGASGASGAPASVAPGQPQGVPPSGAAPMPGGRSSLPPSPPQAEPTPQSTPQSRPQPRAVAPR